MSHFPFMIDLAGETALLVGDVAEQKAELLTSFGCCVQRHCVLTEELLDALAPALVVIARGDPRNETWACLCRSRGILVNVVDEPQLCTFYFPAVIRRGDLTVAISTGGASPAAAAVLRRHIESSLPDATEVILDWAREEKLRLREMGILKQAVAAAFSLGRPLTEDELADLKA